MIDIEIRKDGEIREEGVTVGWVTFETVKAAYDLPGEFTKASDLVEELAACEEQKAQLKADLEAAEDEITELEKKLKQAVRLCNKARGR